MGSGATGLGGGEGIGEKEAISLAIQMHPPPYAVLLDVRKARKVAKSDINIKQRYNIEVVGTLGVLNLASQRGLVDDLPAKLDILQKGNMRIDPKEVTKLREAHAARMQPRHKR